MFQRPNPFPRKALCLLGLSCLPAAALPPPEAQPRGLEINGTSLSLSSKENEALSKLRAAMSAPRAQQDAALEKARSIAQSRDARHALALYELELGRQRKDDATRAAALDVLIASGLTTPDRLAGYLQARGGIAWQARDVATAGTLWARYLELRPADPEGLANLAQVREAEKNLPAAQDLLDKAIAARRAAAQAVPEGWQRQRLSLAYNAQLVRPTLAAARDLVAAYPSADNWRQALVAYRQTAQLRDEAEIDLMRLTRFAGAMKQPAEYQRLAQLLEHGGRAAEAKAVLAEGLARTSLSAAESPTRDIIAEIEGALPKERARIAGARTSLVDADSLIALGRQEEALALYRSLVGKAGTDRGQANVRLGAALLAAGRRADAEAAFRAAATGQGTYADLAAFWLLRLAQP